jgi:hypothetical protein
LSLLGALAVAYTIPIVSKGVLLNEGEINIVCPDFISGNQSVGIYTSRTDVANFSILVDDTVIDTQASPVFSPTGTINASYFYISRGTLQDGNILALNTAADNASLQMRSRHIHPKNYITLYVEFAENTFFHVKPFSSLMLTSSFNTSLPADTTISILSENHYITLGSFTSNITSNNFSCSLLNFTATSTTKTYRIKIDMRRNSNQFDLDLDALYLDFISNQTVQGTIPLFRNLAIDSTAFVDGLHTLKAHVITLDGTTIMEEKHFIIDNQSPAISDADVNPVTLNDSSPITITAAMHDTNLKSSSGEYEVFNNTVIVPNNANEIFNYTNLFPNGTIQFLLRAEDLAGNVEMQIIEFNVSHAMTILYINKTAYEPSAIISYLPTIYAGQNNSISIETNNTSEFFLSTWYNSTFYNTSSYVGNTTHVINILDSREGTTIHFEINLLDSHSISTSNVSLDITFISSPVENVIVLIEFNSITRGNTVMFLCSLSQHANVSVYLFDALDREYNNVMNFTYEKSVDSASEIANFTVRVEIDGSLVFLRHLEINIIPPQTDTNTEWILWTVISIMGVSIIILTVSRQRSKL